MIKQYAIYIILHTSNKETVIKYGGGFGGEGKQISLWQCVTFLEVITMRLTDQIKTSVRPLNLGFKVT